MSWRRVIAWLSFGLVEPPQDSALDRERDALRDLVAGHNEALARAAGHSEQLRERLAAREREVGSAASPGEADALRRELDAAEQAYRALAEARRAALAGARERIDTARDLDTGHATLPGAAHAPVRDKVRDALLALPARPGITALASSALAQQRSLADKRAGFERILAKKLNLGELTHARYQGAVERVCQQVRDNLLDAADSLALASDVDGEALTQRMANLETVCDDARRRELAALGERLALRETQLRHVASLLADNESAITAVVNVSAALAGLRSLERGGALEMDAALGDLEALAERTKAYE